MNLDKSQSEEDLLGELEKQLEFTPVDPLPSPWALSARVVGIAAPLLATSLLVVLNLRVDHDAVGPWILWGGLAVELAVLFLLFALLFSETVPSRRIRTTLWLLVPVTVIALQIGVSQATFLASPLEPALERSFAAGTGCMRRMLLLGVLPLALGLWLATKGTPRPALAGTMLGLFSGLLAESVYRLHCPYSGLEHVLRWHTPTILIMGLVGLAAGLAWDYTAVREWSRRRGSP